MPYDGVMIHTIARELEASLCGARIDRILQPERDEIHLVLRAPGKKARLILSSNAQFARVYVSGEATRQDDHPPMFCMLLRKHLSGGKLLRVRQLGLDRVLYFDFSAHDELGDEAVWTIAVEMMGKHSNIILVNQNGAIVDAIKRVYPEKSRVRPVLPAMEYTAPPGAVKRDPLTMNERDFGELVDSLPDGDREKQLMGALQGVSPGTAREILTLAQMNDAGFSKLEGAAAGRLKAALAAFFGRLQKDEIAPVVRVDAQGVPRDVQPFAYCSTPQWETKPFDTPSEAAEAFFYGRTHALRVGQKSADLAHLLKTRIERAEKKLALQQAELLQAENAESLRLYGELLSAYIYMIEKGAPSVSVPDYTKEDQPEITIPLSPALSPSQNVQEYFRRYTRAKSAQHQLAGRIAQSEEELETLRQHEYNLSECRSEAEIDDVRREMVESGVLRRAPQKNGRPQQKKKNAPFVFDEFTTAAGLRVLVGRNNRQNDALTKSAAPEDVWLHVLKRPGSHVIIQTNGGDADDASIIEAARIAAAYSSAKNDTRVAVDYTKKKYVHKPSGAAAGFVTYTHQQTLIVEPMKTDPMQQ